MKYPSEQIGRLKIRDPVTIDLVRDGPSNVAIWSWECAERVLPYFEMKYPADRRPRRALDVLHDWIETGEFKMAVIRGASLAAHAAARDTGEDGPARSAARAAGQAVATAHVPAHSVGSAIYAQQAVHRAAPPSAADAAAAREKDWQIHRLVGLRSAAIRRSTRLFRSRSSSGRD